MKKTFIIFLLLFLIFLPFKEIFALEFDPNYIISDEEMNDYQSMTLQDIKDFLANHHSFLLHYKCRDKNNILREAPEIIYTLSQKNKINPKFMLVLLQKEQSLIEDPHPSEGQLNAATGYGCPDNSGCNPRWKGFYRQVNSAYLQFRSYLDENYLYRYKKNNTYIFNRYHTKTKTIDIVTPLNNATAALYNYTPHVYYGNYNFWKIWNKYFPKKYTYYPDGTLLREKGTTDIYLIDNNKKRLFKSKSAFLSRYSFDKVIDVNKNILDAYKNGKPIKYANYSLLQTPDKTIYLLVDNKIRKISSNKVFKKIGFNKNEIIKVEKEEIKDYNIGNPITETDIYPRGALLQDIKTGGVFFVKDGIKYPIWHKIIMEINFPNKKIIKATPKELAKYKKGAPVKLKDGELIKSVLDPRVFVISNGKKRPIANEETFNELGYRWSDILTVNGRILEIHPTGKMIDTTLEDKNITTATIK